MPNWKKVITSGSNPELNNITASGVIDIKGTSAHLPPDGAIRLAYNSDKLSVNSEHGYVRLGVVAGDSVKFFTDGDDYHFDESVVVDGGVFASKDEDLILRRDFDDTTYNQIKIADDSYELKLDNTVRHSIDGVGNNTFSGNITSSGLHTSGDISSSGNIIADRYYGNDDDSYMEFTDDAFFVRAGSNSIRFQVTSEYLMSVLPFRALSHITASGNISASGTSHTFGGQTTLNQITASAITAVNLEINESATIGGILAANGTDSAHTFAGKIETPSVFTHQIGELPASGPGIKIVNHITASGNISASGFLSAKHLILSGGSGVFTSASLAAGGGGGAVSAVANGSDNRLATFSSANALNGEANLTFDGSTLEVVGNISASGNTQVNQITASAFQFVGSGTAELDVQGDITASGNISASGEIRGASLKVGTKSVTVEANSIINQDLSTDGDAQFNSLVLGGADPIAFIGQSNYSIGSDNPIDFDLKDNNASALSFDTTGKAGMLEFVTTNGSEKVKVSSEFIVAGTMSGSTAIVDDLTSNSITASNSILLPHEKTITFYNDGNSIASSGDLSTKSITITAENNITMVPGTNNAVDINGNLDASGYALFTGAVTASGNISSSGTIITEKLNVNPKSPISPNMSFGSWNIGYGTAAELTGSISSDGNGYGEIAHFGNGATLAGRVYCLKSDSTWEIATDTGPVSSSLLAVAMGTHASASGMLLRGVVKGDRHDTLTVGQKVYNEGNGRVAPAAGSDSGDVVRVLGYVLNATNDIIYFNPDNTWVEIA